MKIGNNKEVLKDVFLLIMDVSKAKLNDKAIKDALQNVEYDEDAEVDKNQKPIKDIAKAAKLDDRKVADTISMGLMSSSLFEKLDKVKRRWTDQYPAVFINPGAALRNKIVTFVGDHAKSRCPYSAVKEFMNKLEEDEEIGRKPSPKYITNNKHLFKKVKVGNEEYIRLTNIGKRIYNHLKEQSKEDINENYGRPSMMTRPQLKELKRIINEMNMRWKYGGGREQRYQAKLMINSRGIPIIAFNRPLPEDLNIKWFGEFTNETKKSEILNDKSNMKVNKNKPPMKENLAKSVLIHENKKIGKPIITSSTPKGSNFFYDMWMKHAVQTFESIGFNKSQLAELRKIINELNKTWKHEARLMPENKGGVRIQFDTQLTEETAKQYTEDFNKAIAESDVLRDYAFIMNESKLFENLTPSAFAEIVEKHNKEWDFKGTVSEYTVTFEEGIPPEVLEQYTEDIVGSDSSLKVINKTDNSITFESAIKGVPDKPKPNDRVNGIEFHPPTFNAPDAPPAASDMPVGEADDIQQGATSDDPEVFAKQMIINSTVNNNPDFSKDLALQRLQRDLKSAKQGLTSYERRQKQHTDPEEFDTIIEKTKKWIDELDKEIKSGGKWVEQLLNDVKNKDYKEIEKWDIREGATNENGLGDIQDFYRAAKQAEKDGNIRGLSKLYTGDNDPIEYHFLFINLPDREDVKVYFDHLSQVVVMEIDGVDDDISIDGFKEFIGESVSEGLKGKSKDEMKKIVENIFDVIMKTKFHDQAHEELDKLLADHNVSFDGHGKITIEDSEGQEIIYTISIS